MNLSISTKFRLPPLIEEETDEIYPVIKKKICRVNQTKKLPSGIHACELSFSI